MLHFFLYHHAARLHVVVLQFRLLYSSGYHVAQFRNHQFLVDGSNGFLYQFLAFEVHRIGIFVVDAIPEFLELLLRKVLIQSVLRSLRCTSVFYHTVKGRRIPNAFYQFVNPFAVWLYFIWQCCECSRCCGRAVSIGYMTFVIHITVLYQIEIYLLGF